VIVKQFEVGNFNVFSYLIADEQAKEGLFIDPPQNTTCFSRRAASLGLTIKYIVNTHAHIDHVMGNREMVRRTGAKVIIHEADAAGILETPDTVLEMFGAKEPLRQISQFRMANQSGGQRCAESAPYAGPYPGWDVPLRAGHGLHRRHIVCRIRGQNRLSGRILSAAGTINQNEAVHPSGRYGHIPRATTYGDSPTSYCLSREKLTNAFVRG